MAFINDSALDALVNYVKTNGTRIDICSQEPTTYAEATSTYTLGNDTVTITGPTNGATNGRSVTVPAVSDANVTGTGTASHWALTDGSATLVATGALSSSQAVTSGNLFNLTTFDINAADAT